MNTLYTPEISLRRAVALTGNDTPQKIDESASHHLNLVSQAQGLMSSLKTNTTLQQEAISFAIQGLTMAYGALSEHLLKTAIERSQFNDECANFLVTFILHRELEPQELYKEQHAIETFWSLIQKECSSFIRYFGIQEHAEPEHPKIIHLAVLPYFRTSQALNQKSPVASQYDQHQYAIYLFLKTCLPNQEYYQHYKQSSHLRLKIESFFTQHNYLNRFRAPLLIINALANLLWSLQHPFDSATGSPLSLEECINLCIKAEQFINILLDDYEHSIFAKIDTRTQTLKNYFLNIERYIKSLRAAFQYQSSNDLNLQDVSDSMHRGSRIMANKLLELIYQNPNATEKFTALYLGLGETILQQPKLFQTALPKTTKFTIPILNTTPCTLSDALIILAHQKPKHRQAFLKTLRKSSQDSHFILYQTLFQIEQQFLIPFEHLILQSARKKQTATTLAQSEIAKYFLSIMFLILECFPIFTDTRPLELQQADIQADHRQNDSIIQMAASTEVNKYYRWSIAIFLQQQHGSSYDKIEQLLSELNQMRLMTRLLDKLSSIVLENQILLQQLQFRTTVISILKKIRLSYRALNNRLNGIEEAMNHDDTIERNEKRVLQPMLDDVEAVLEVTERSISKISSLINQPTFRQKQQQDIERRLSEIGQDYHIIFNEPLSLNLSPSLSTMSMLAAPEPVPAPDLIIETHSPQKLIDLVQQCYQDLSFASKLHPKGRSLTLLEGELQQLPHASTAQLKLYLLRIIEICASPRSTYFFQAAYGETRSAKTLIQTLLSQEFNQDINYLGILFDNDSVTVASVHESQVLSKIHELRISNRWSEIAPEHLHVAPRI